VTLHSLHSPDGHPTLGGAIRATGTASCAGRPWAKVRPSLGVSFPGGRSESGNGLGFGFGARYRKPGSGIGRQDTMDNQRGRTGVARGFV
jgi:hypothetical protein